MEFDSPVTYEAYDGAYPAADLASQRAFPAPLVPEQRVEYPEPPMLGAIRQSRISEPAVHFVIFGPQRDMTAAEALRYYSQPQLHEGEQV